MTESSLQVIRGARVLDVAAGRAPLLEVLVRGDTIEAIGPPGMAAPEAAVVIDARRRLLMPGLINTHTHGHGALGKGRGDRWTLELLLNAGPWVSGGRTLEDKYLSAQLNAAEMVRKGCTACYDLYFEFPTPSSEGIAAVARGYADVGMRAVIAPMMADQSLYEAIPGLLEHLPGSARKDAERLRLAPLAESIKACRTLLAGWSHDSDGIRPALAPTIPHHCTEDFLRACRDLAKDHGVGLHMHLAESKVQALTGKTRYGKTLTAYLEDMAYLGPSFIAAHCVWLDDDDIKRLSDHGCAITHQPSCNLRLGCGIAPVRAFLDAGIPVGIGTDGSASSDNQNMFEALRLAANVSRILGPDYERWLSAPEALSMATTGGARLLGFEDRLGRIETGCLADIVFLDLDNLNYVPLNDPVNQVVNCEDASAVASVMIAGRMVLDNGAFTTLDHGKLRRDVEDAMARLNETTRASKQLALGLEGLVGGFCVGLARSPYHVQRTLPCTGTTTREHPA